MWTLSGFSDEISPDLDEQAAHVTSLGLSHIEFRSAWDTNVLDLDEDQLARAERILNQHDLKVSSIGSPIGKSGIHEHSDAHERDARRAVDLAHRFGAQYIRVFSFFIPDGQDPDDSREEVIRRMRSLADIAEQGGVTLVHENEKGIYGDIPRRCVDIIRNVDSPHLRAAWDAANFVQVGVRPFTDGYAEIRPYLEYVQIKDALLTSREVVAAGRGDGEVVETIRALHRDGFDGFFSLEPHLSDAHSLGGFSGPGWFSEAHRAFTQILDSEGIEYR